MRKYKKMKTMMRKFVTTLCAVTFCVVAAAQETHYHKGLRPQEETDQYGGGADMNPGGGYYWSRVRNVDDVRITKESAADSIARRNEFKRLCELAYDAYGVRDYYHTIMYGDSALAKIYHTPELYYFMAVSYDKLGDYKHAEWCFKRSLKAGYVPALEPYQQFKDRMKQMKAEEKKRKKEEKKKRLN